MKYPIAGSATTSGEPFSPRATMAQFNLCSPKSNANASHFWLNEGWTTYSERLLQHYVHSPAERDFSYIIGRKSLRDDLKLYENQPKYQRLSIEFAYGEDPDDAYSTVPYEKGANFLLYLGMYIFVHSRQCVSLLSIFACYRALVRRFGDILALCQRLRCYFPRQSHPN